MRARQPRDCGSDRASAVELNGASIGETLRLSVDQAALRQPRALPLPKIKMWRVAHTHS